MDTCGLVKGNVHGIRRPLPGGDLRAIHPCFIDHEGIQLGMVAAQRLQGRRRKPQVFARHQIRIGVVVHHGVVFIRPSDAVEAEPAVSARGIEAQIEPQPRCFDQHLGPFVV